jgi:ABC-type multidrug transport system permease subunit
MCDQALQPVENKQFLSMDDVVFLRFGRSSESARLVSQIDQVSNAVLFVCVLTLLFMIVTYFH